MIEACQFNEELFAMTQEKLLNILQELSSQIDGKALSSLERMVERAGRELLRVLLQECIQAQGTGDIGGTVRGKDGVLRTHRRTRPINITTLFGDITVDRVVYSSPKHDALAPKEAMLNLPSNSYSHVLARRVAREAVKGSFQEAVASIKEYTGIDIPKRQAEEIIIKSAIDFRSFYEERSVDKSMNKEDLQLLILSTDGKGIVVRKEDLRGETKKRVEQEKKLKKRLSKGEKKNAKRMAQVASVYSIACHFRTPEEIMNGNKNKNTSRPQNKRVWASIAEEQNTIIADMFDEAVKRDPSYAKEWVILVDGQPQQLKQIKNQLKKRQIKASIVVDLIHVLEYLWKASHDFYTEGSKEGEDWVNRHLLMVLNGKASRVAAAMKRSATCRKLEKRGGVNTCARYLCKYSPYLNYAEYLKKGWPIATGIIEGACRHLVKDRMDITGARWSLSGAEAILRLRSIHSSGDWDEYWKYHEDQEYLRNHSSFYENPDLISPSKMVQIG